MASGSLRYSDPESVSSEVHANPERLWSQSCAKKFERQAHRLQLQQLVGWRRGSGALQLHGPPSHGTAHLIILHLYLQQHAAHPRHVPPLRPIA